VLSGGTDEKTDDEAWLLRMQAADIQAAPVGRLFDSGIGHAVVRDGGAKQDAAGASCPVIRAQTRDILMRFLAAGYIDAEVAAPPPCRACVPASSSRRGAGVCSAPADGGAAVAAAGQASTP
jgi:hypothetical protein